MNHTSNKPETKPNVSPDRTHYDQRNGAHTPPYRKPTPPPPPRPKK